MGWRFETFADVLPFGMLVEDGVMLTPLARLFRSIEVVPKDYWFRSEEEWAYANAQLKMSCSYLGKGWTIWSDAMRYKIKNLERITSDHAPDIARRIDEAHSRTVSTYFENRFVITLCFTIPDRSDFLFSSSKKKKTKSQKTVEEIRGTTAKFIEDTNDIVSLLASAYEIARPLNSQELLTYLHSTYADRKPVIVPETPAFLDYVMADRIIHQRPVPRLDDEYLHVASVTDTPDETRVSMLNALLSAPFEFRFTTRFICFSKEDSKKKIDELRTSHYMKRKGAGGMLGEAVFKESTELIDTEAMQHVEDADEAMRSLARTGTLYGNITATLVVRSPDYDRGKKTLDYLRAILRDKAFVVKREEMNALEAFLGTIPGNDHFNSRGYVVSTANLIHFYPQTKPWQGVRINEDLQKHFGYEEPHIIGRAGSSIYYFNQNIGELGHTTVIGPSRSGKSVFLNFKASQWLAHYDNSREVMLSVDSHLDGTMTNCMNHGGLVYHFGKEGSPYLLNPFWELNEGNLQYTDSLGVVFESYFKEKGMDITAKRVKAIRDSLRKQATLRPEKRSFDSLRSYLKSNDPDFEEYIQPFVDGQYHTLFSNEADTFQDNRFILFELRTLMNMGDDITRFVLQYIFLKLEALFALKKYPYSVDIDEGWRLLQHDAAMETFINWLRTSAKMRVYVTLATQQITELSGKHFEIIANQCQNRVFLPNPQATKFRALYATMGVEEEDLESLKAAKPRRDLFHVTPSAKQIFTMALDAQQLDLLLKPTEVIS